MAILYTIELLVMLGNSCWVHDYGGGNLPARYGELRSYFIRRRAVAKLIKTTPSIARNLTILATYPRWSSQPSLTYYLMFLSCLEDSGIPI